MMGGSSWRPALRRNLGGAALIGAVAPLLAVLSCGPSSDSTQTSGTGNGPPDSASVGDFCIEAGVEPRWQGTEVAALGRPEEPSRLGVYIDVSTPLGGFLPLSGRGGQETSTLRTLAQLASEYLLARYGGGGVEIAWRGVGHELASTGPPRDLTRDDFSGRSSQLQLALTEMFADFQSGRAEASALVTDLIATDDDGIVGPLALISQISDWLASQDVRSGEFHLALLAARADYWGVTHRRACPERAGLGCWYSERDRENRFRRLEGVEKLPLYVVLAGRGRDRIVEVVQSMHRDLVGLGIDAQWELLTTASGSGSVTLPCGVFERSDSGERDDGQYLLLRDEVGFRCLKSGTAEIACGIGSGMEFTAAEVVPEEASGELEPDEDWTPLTDVFSASVSGNELVLAVDCRSLRGPRTASDTPTRELRLGVAAQALQSDEHLADWESWSSTLEEMGRTVQLAEFIRQLRLAPDDYGIVLPPLQIAEPGRLDGPFRECPLEEPDGEVTEIPEE